MLTTTNLWVAAFEDRDLSRVAAERYLMLHAADGVPETRWAAGGRLSNLFGRLRSIGDRRRLAEIEAQPCQPTMAS
jgi:hypothetical protein